MAEGVSEFDVARVLVLLEDGHRTRAEVDATDQLTDALDVAIQRGLAVADFRLTKDGRERLAGFRKLFGPAEDEGPVCTCSGPVYGVHATGCAHPNEYGEAGRV